MIARLVEQKIIILRSAKKQQIVVSVETMILKLN